MIDVMRSYQTSSNLVQSNQDLLKETIQKLGQAPQGLTRARRRRITMRALSIAATGMMAQQNNVEVIANNLANMNTTGFKQQRAEFEDLLYQNLQTTGTASSDSGTVLPSGVQIGVGVRTASVYREFGQGDLAQYLEPLRSRDPGQRLLPHSDARRLRCLHARRRFRAVAGRPDRHRSGLHGRARHHVFRKMR